MDNLIILPKRKISFFLQVTGFIFFAALFYMSWHFYLERMLSSGASFYVFQFMQTDSIVPRDGRYGDYITQFLPFLLYKMHMPLKAILIGYSVGFIILHYLVFLFITLILRHSGAGIALMLACCLSYYYAFYMPTMELHEDIVLGVLLWAIIHPEEPYTINQQYLATCGAILTIVLMSFFHPMGIFLVAFVLGMEMFGMKRFGDNQLWLITGVGLCWYILKFYMLTEQADEQELILSFDQASAHLMGFRHWASTAYFDNLTYLHFGFLKWIAIGCLLLTLRKGILTFLFLVSYILGVSLLFWGNFRVGTSPATFENYYAVYGFFLALIFVSIFYLPRRKNLVLLLSLPLLLGAVIKIYHAHDMITYKDAYLKRIVNNARSKGESKCIIDSKCYPYDIAWDSWNIAFETLTISSLNSADSSVTVFIQNPEFAVMCDTMQHKKDVFLGVHFLPIWYSSAQMPEGYFKLPAEGYSYLTHSQNDTAFHENIYSAGNVSIRPLLQSAITKSNNWLTVIPVEIVNTSGRMIPSIPGKQNGVYLSYNLYDGKGKLLQKGVKEPLETDIDAESVEGMIVYCPHDKGVYYAQPNLITDGKRSWDIPAESVKITVE